MPFVHKNVLAGRPGGIADFPPKVSLHPHYPLKTLPRGASSPCRAASPGIGRGKWGYECKRARRGLREEERPPLGGCGRRLRQELSIGLVQRKVWTAKLVQICQKVRNGKYKKNTCLYFGSEVHIQTRVLFGKLVGVRKEGRIWAERRASFCMRRSF